MAQRPSPTDLSPALPNAPVRLLDAICARDFDQAGSCIHEGAVLRAVLPPRLLEATGRDEIVDWFRRWFGGAATFDVVDRAHTDVASRTRLTWRFAVSPHPGTQDPGPHLIEQTLFCDEVDGAITGIDLLCSGFRAVAP